MADNKKYYYLKLKENFYDSEQMIILQNMQDGYLYSDILMKLYLRSLKTDGKLMFNNIIPYTPSILAQVVRHQVGTVEKALKIFKELGLVEILDNGAIYMLDIQNFIGKSSTEADRIRQYRQEISNEKILGCTNVQQMNDKNTPEIEIEIEKDIKKENIKRKKYGNFGRIKLSDKEYEKLIKEFGEDFIKEQIRLLDEYVESNNNKNKYSNFNLVLRKSIRENWFNKTKEKEPPNWFYKDLDKEEITKEEQNELDNILKEMESE